MKNFTLLLSLILLTNILYAASEDSNSSYETLSSSSDLSGYIIDDGSGVINNQHTEQNSTKPQ